MSRECRSSLSNRWCDHFSLEKVATVLCALLKCLPWKKKMSLVCYLFWYVNMKFKGSKYWNNLCYNICQQCIHSSSIKVPRVWPSRWCGECSFLYQYRSWAEGKEAGWGEGWPPRVERVGLCLNIKSSYLKVTCTFRENCLLGYPFPPRRFFFLARVFSRRSHAFNSTCASPEYD